MIINHNLMAMNTHRQLGMNQTAASKSMEKLSSGFRINRAGDDAAGLAISEKMRGQIRGLKQAARNAQDGISLIQTAEGALNETHAILQRMRELAVQSATDTNTGVDRGEIQKEINQLADELSRISNDTEFNKKTLLNGDMGKVAQKTAGSASLSELQATGADLDSGSYTLTLTNAGTDTFTVTSGSTAVTAGDISGHISLEAGANIEYGSYTLTVTDFNSVSGTANFELTGPDGKKTEISGHGVAAALTIGGIKVALNSEAVTGNGTVKFDLTANGLEIALSGNKTASTGAITAYSGGTLNVGGFEFTVTTGKGATNDKADYTVINKAVKFHIGANEDQNTQLAINNMSAQALGVDSLILTTQEGANASIKTIDGAIEKVSAERSKLGALQNRLEHTISNLGTSAENLQAAESRIRDLDMAEEIMAFTKNNILQQAATAMLAQANMAPQSVLQLLG